jgi:hypothetical protein
MRRSYGFRTFRILELALYHSLGKLHEPELTHEFFRRVRNLSKPMNRAYLFGLLDTPRYHLMVAVIALIVLALIISAWVHIHKTLSRQQRILAAVARELSSIHGVGRVNESTATHVVTGQAA